MGYYDDMYHVERKKQRQPGRGKFIFTSLTSAVIGGLIVHLLSPAVPSAVLDTTSSQSSPSVNTSESIPTVQPISINVDNATVRAVEKVEKTVVGITNIQRVADIWSRQTSSVTSGEGSGVIFKKENGKAYIITNFHVIEDAQKLEVSLPGGDKEEAKVVGYDRLMDLAVLEIDGSKVNQVAELGDSKQLKVGEPILAIGNPLGQKFSRTVTQGIVSSLERSMPIDIDNDSQPEWELDVLQTDAAINPGNSGGALVNMYGQVIGINTLKIAREGVEGLGFAIPINDVKKIVEQFMQHGYVQRAFLGITPYDLSKVPSYALKEELNLPSDVTAGIVVRDISTVSPASKAGLRQFDVIVKIDDQEITNSAQLHKFLTLNKKPGETVEITYYRDGFKKTVKVTLATKPRE